MNDAYIINGTRTAIGNFGGTLSSIRPDDLAAHVLSALLKQNPSLDPSAIEDVIVGCANQSGEDNRNIARMSLLLAGYPTTVPGETVNRLCASGLSASIAAARSIMCGDTDVMVAGGVESMTRAPWVMSKASSAFGRDSQMFDSSFGWRFINPKMQEMYGTDAMGQTAENLAELHKINRADQDAFAFWSQQKAAAAQNNGRFEKEITPINIPQRKGDALVLLKMNLLKTTPPLKG